MKLRQLGRTQTQLSKLINKMLNCFQSMVYRNNFQFSIICAAPMASTNTNCWESTKIKKGLE